MLDAFHIVKLATQVVDEVRRRVQQDIHGGTAAARDDPLYRIRNILRAGEGHLTDRQRARLEKAFTADQRHLEVEVRLAMRPAGPLVLPPRQPRRRPAGRREDPRLLLIVPDPRGRPPRAHLKQWSREFHGYFDTAGASNGGPAVINGLIELHRRVARGFRNRDNYRLRVLLGRALFT